MSRVDLAKEKPTEDTEHIESCKNCEEEIGSEAKPLRCAECKQAGHLACWGVLYCPPLEQEWLCLECMQANPNQKHKVGFKRSRRKRSSRFMLVDGHVVMKLNQYDLLSGEPSVFQQELKEAEPVETVFDLPSQAELKQIIMQGIQYLSVLSSKGGPTLAELQVWCASQLSLPRGGQCQELEKAVQDLCQKLHESSNLALSRGKPPSNKERAALWPGDQASLNHFIKELWAWAVENASGNKIAPTGTETIFKEMNLKNNDVLKFIQTLSEHGFIEKSSDSASILGHSVPFVYSVVTNKLLPVKKQSSSEKKPVKQKYGFQGMNEKILKAAAEDQAKQSVYLAHFREWLAPFINDREKTALEKVAKSHALRGSERQGVLKGHLTIAHAITEQPPQIVGGAMRPYQLEGLSWMVYLFQHGVPVILGDEMGLGKTLQTIAFIAHLKFALNICGPHLIVCPMSVLSSWLGEFKKWCPSLNVVRLHSSSTDEKKRLKKELALHLAVYDVVITTYEMVLEMHHPIVWRTVILDEGHKIKNDEAIISGKVRTLRSQSRIILTGTPLQNTLKELWSLLNYLLPTIFKSSDPFDTAFNLTSSMINADVLSKAHYCLKPFLLRRLKTEVEYNIPPKKVIEVKLSLTEAQKFWYKAFILRESPLLKRLEESVAQGGEGYVPGTQSDWKRLQNLMMQLRKVSNHPYCINDADPNPGSITEDIVNVSTKMNFLDRVLKKLQPKGHRVVIFSAFTTMLDIIEDFLHLRGYRFCRLDGSTNRVQRTINMSQFQKENSKIFIFIMTSRAGGLGITLTKADTVILYDSDWNPQVDLQAMDRVHRIGQTKPVHVYRLVTSGTVEERMVLRAQKKLYLDKMVNRGSTQMSEAMESLDTAELLKTLKFGCNAVFGAGSVADMSDQQIENMIDRQNVKEDTETDETLVNAATFDTTQEPVALKSLEGEDFSKFAGASTKTIAQEYEALQSQRVRSERFMQINGYTVLKMNNYTLEDGEPSVFKTECHTKYAGKDTKNSRKVAGRDFYNEEHCLNCWDGGDLLMCDICPASFHLACSGDDYVSKKGWWFCPRHNCHLCFRKPADVGGLLFSCIGCPVSYCDDCLPHGYEILDRCLRFERLGYDGCKQSCNIFCSDDCKEFVMKRVPEEEDSQEIIVWNPKIKPEPWFKNSQFSSPAENPAPSKSPLKEKKRPKTKAKDKVNPTPTKSPLKEQKTPKATKKCFSSPSKKPTNDQKTPTTKAQSSGKRKSVEAVESPKSVSKTPKKQKSSPANQPRSSTKKGSVEETYAVGEKVEVKFQGIWNGWFSGVITHCNDDGSADVRFEDGSQYDQIQPRRLRKIG